MSIPKAVTLEDIGYSGFFETAKKNLCVSDYAVARVIAEHRGAYSVRDAQGDYFATITGKHIYTAISRDDYPAVGDWVAISKLEQNKAIIRGILPRKTTLKKKYSNKQENQLIASNIDIAFITESMDRDYNLNRFERFLVLARDGGITPTIILNKVDLISENELNLRIAQIKNRFVSVDVIPTCTVTKQGVYDLATYIERGKTYCFLGSSGVGKSSLINALLGQDEIRTREISMSLGRGKHTTTARELYVLENGGLLIDTPGMREVGIPSSEIGVENVFNEIGALAKNCKFSDCTHTSEPGCSVLQAVHSKSLDEQRYSNYQKLKKESDFYELTELEKRRKDRKFGKFVKNALQELKK